MLGKEHRFLAPEYSTSAVLDIFGDHVAIFSHVELGRMSDDASFTMVINKDIADAFRVWFRVMWNSAKKWSGSLNYFR